MATIGRRAADGQGEKVVGWREYWELKLPGVEPPAGFAELASPLMSSSEIEASFICISRARYSFCFCTRLDMSVCAAANVSVGPPASTCIFHFFYEYHKNCKASPLAGPQPIDHQALLNPAPNNAFFNSSYLLLNLDNFISLPPLTNSLLQSQTFLPRALADMLPFQNSKLSEALSLLHILPSSPMANSMQETLEFCEASPQNDEESLQCITSIESMVDFASNSLGSHAMVLTPTLAAEGSRSEAKIDKIENMTTNLEDSTSTCHNLVYPYLVYGCHVTRGSSVLRVSFEGIQGDALVVCHHNTSTWNPNHPAFAQLQASPGHGGEICHWIPRHHFVWLPLSTSPF